MSLSAQLKRHVTAMPVETLLLPPDQAGIDRAAALLQRGENVAFPTETVYGLGGDACNDKAVAGIFAAKDRPEFNPLIVHVSDLAAAQANAVFSTEALALARAFWPGPLTLVLPLRPGAGISPLVTAGLDTVAIRVPAHPLAQQLLARFGGPVAAPSANPSGRISPTRADHVMQGLAGRIAAVLDGGPCPVGVESTIIGFKDGPQLLRPGGLAMEQIEALLQRPVPLSVGGEKPVAPGQLASHYAPRACLRLNAPEAGGAVHLAFGPSDAVLNLSATADLTEAAANLFHLLRRADELAGPKGLITVAPIPMQGLGLAINDRLARAAAPRE
jgi:L-threonylcarbamoyladenylate synthase